MLAISIIPNSQTKSQSNLISITNTTPENQHLFLVCINICRGLLFVTALTISSGILAELEFKIQTPFRKILHNNLTTRTIKIRFLPHIHTSLYRIHYHQPRPLMPALPPPLSPQLTESRRHTW